MHNRNLSEMLPYEKLAVLGIDREKASGEVTPLLQVSIRAQNGDVITLPLKLQLTTDQQGNPALLAYPVRAALETERNKALLLTDQEAERLTKGEVIRKAVEVRGEKTPAGPRNEVGCPPKGNGHSAGAETEGHGEAQRY